MPEPSHRILYNGRPLDTSPDVFGELKASDDALSDVGELRRRMAEDGYLYLPGLLDLELIRAVREEVFRRAARLGALHPDHPPYEGICHPDPERSFRPALDYRPDRTSEPLDDCQPLREVLFKGRMVQFFEAFLGGPVRSLDHIWFRAKGSGIGKPTPPHLDILYMGRGTHNLYTAWVPYVDVDYEMGGLMMLEHSHRIAELRNGYGQRDIDAYCADSPDAPQIESGEKMWQQSGAYSLDAIGTRAELGGRWLTTSFRMGDALIFSPYTLHASTDNQTPRMRISSDTRYQLASDPVDERWVGPDPIGHGRAAKRSMIC